MPVTVINPTSTTYSGPTPIGLTSRAEIEALYGSIGIENITDDYSGGDVDEVINRFIFDAEQTIGIRLSGYYNIAELVNSNWARSRATWIAAHLLSQRRGNEHYFSSMYEMAMEEINAMATGEMPPDPSIPFAGYSVPAMSNITVDDGWNQSKLRVQPIISSFGARHPNQHIVWGSFWSWV